MKKLTSLLLIFTLSFFNITNVALAATFTTATEAEFDEGSYNSNTRYFDNNLQIKGYLTNERELPDGNIDSNGINMANNELNLHLNEADGATSFADTSTANLTMSCSGNECPSHTAEGKMSNSFIFDGNDFISSSGANLALTSDFTISAWVKDERSSTGYKGIAGKMIHSGDQYKGYLIRKDIGNKFSFIIGDNAFPEIVNSDPSNNNLWHHIVGVYDDGYMYLYVDGNLEDQSTSQVSITDSEDNFVIGRHYADYHGHYFDGNIDEVAVWSRALSNNEISTIYDRQVNKYSTNSGTYRSEILDSTSTESTWDSIDWLQGHCYACELPNNQSIETGYNNNADMSNNTLNLHLNEVSGATSFSDDSGNNANGTCSGNDCPTADEPGKLNQAVEFYEEGGYPKSIRIDNFDESTFADGIGTVEMWMTPTLRDYDYLFEHNNDGTEDRVSIVWDIDQDGNDTIGANLLQGGSTAYGPWYGFAADTSNWTINSNEWHHVAFVFDTSTGAGTDNMWLYIDGVLKKAAEGERTFFPNGKDSGQTNRIWLGNSSDDSYSHSFHGKMDEVATYSTALSATEIQNHYLRGALDLGLETRTCDDPSCSGETFTDINQTSPATLTLADNQYFQYQFALSSENAAFSPEIESVNISYTPPGGGGGNVPEFSDYTYALTLIIGMLLMYNYGNFEISYNQPNKTGK